MLILGLSAACAPNLAQNYKAIRPSLVAHQPAQALRYLQGAKERVYGVNNRLLYLMDLAMVQFDGGDFAGCIATLEQGKAWLVEHSGSQVGHEAWAWLSNDNALPYRGEDFEKVFVHVLEALSFAQAGNLSDARVEARQVASLLKRLTQHLEGKPITYQDDAFAHFLSGLLFEADIGELSHTSDARIEYDRALQLYQEVDGPAYGVALPRGLRVARMRVAETAHASPATHRNTDGRLVVFTLVGEAPRKREAAWEVLLGPNIYRVAYPYFASHCKRLPPRITVGPMDQGLVPELVMDVQAIARRNLSDHMDRIKQRVLAREVAKYAAGTVTEGIGLERGGAAGLGLFLAGLALNTVTAATSEADTRSWTTLPEAIYMAEASLPAGPITLQVGARAPMSLTLAPRETLFVAVRALAD